MKIRALSSRKIFSSYVDYIDTSRNPDSPIILYKNNVKRIIEVEKIVFPKVSNSPEHVKVYYKAIEKSDTNEKTSRWVADMSFSMTDVNNVLDDKANIQFTVTKYNTYTIDKG
jgi:type IV secretion system protein VirB8